MKHLLISALITLSFIFGVGLVVYNYPPVVYLAVESTGNFGGITEIVGTDILKDFPAVYNANLAQLMRMSTTSVNSLTTLSNLVSIGTITTGVFDGTTILVDAGGTGVETFTDNGVLVGSGTSAITALTVGTNGQLLIGSTSADPVFATFNCDRSLTCTTGAGTLEIDADVELYTKTFSINLASTTLSTTTQAAKFEVPLAFTITNVTCSTDVGTTTVQLDERAEGSENVAGTDIMTAQLDCGSGTDINNTTTFVNAGITARNLINLGIDKTDDQASGATPTVVDIYIRGTFND